MSGPIRTERHGEILVVISDNPPVNALGAAVRQGLEAAVKEGVAEADRRGDPRHRAGRRVRGDARLPLPRGGGEC
jgi:hypothetical protein